MKTSYSRTYMRDVGSRPMILTYDHIMIILETYSYNLNKIK